MTTEDTGGIDLHDVTPGAVVIPPAKEPPRRQWGLIAAIVVFALAVAGLGTYVIVSQRATIDSQATRISEQNSTIREQSKELAASYENAQDLYDQLLGLGQKPDGVRPVSVPGPQGDTGLPGKDGKDGTNGLNGKDGAPGVNGLDGKNGQDGINGKDGADGAPGAPGKDGTDGKDGRGVASVQCVLTDTGTAFRFTFTDSTTQDIPAMCIAPTPTP